MHEKDEDKAQKLLGELNTHRRAKDRAEQQKKAKHGQKRGAHVSIEELDRQILEDLNLVKLFGKADLESLRARQRGNHSHAEEPPAGPLPCQAPAVSKPRSVCHVHPRAASWTCAATHSRNGSSRAGTAASAAADSVRTLPVEASYSAGCGGNRVRKRQHARRT
jgi:hypothetical protein